MLDFPTDDQPSRSAWAEFILALLASEAGDGTETPDTLNRAQRIVDSAAQIEKTAWNE